MRHAPILILGSLATLACRAHPVPPQPQDPVREASVPAEPVPAAVEPDAPRVELPPSWREMSDLSFERTLEEWLPPGEWRTFSPADLETMGTALDAGERVALRAAVILGRSKDPEAAELLLVRLEKRAVERDPADVVAAAALADDFAPGASATNAAARLASLGAGRRPHPDPFVRVECARSALELGRDEGIPFLLQVLRAGTSAGRKLDPGELAEDVAFLQTRAAAALSARAGTANRFRPEASVQEREAEAARLEALLPRPPERKR